MRWWAAILSWLRRRFIRLSPTERRLKRLRAVYQAEVGLHSRRVRNILRGEVAPEYYPHYDRLLRFEQVTADLLRKDIRLAIPDLLPHVYALTERVARLIEQLQRGDQLMALYPEGSVEQQMVAEARLQLLARIEEAMALQESIPARLLQLSAASSAGRDFERVRESLADLDTRLEGMVDSYAHLDALYHLSDVSHAEENNS
jgi:hypothetical protein